MGLADFIRSNQDDIISEWEAFARTCMPGTNRMDRGALRDHIIELLDFIASDLESLQTKREQIEKSKGKGPESEGAARAHGQQRFAAGFDTLEMLSEFRALRASVVKLWLAAEKPQPGTGEALAELIRFNEAIDQAMTESLDRFTAEEVRARSLFLGTLIHDFRTPLGAISMSAQLLLRRGQLSADDVKLASQIERSVANISHLVSNMIDVVRIRLGKPLPLVPAPMDMGTAVYDAVKETQMAYPGRKIIVEAQGDLQGFWDKIRIRQVLSNLIGNAIQHGTRTSSVDINVIDAGDDVVLTVHNEGAIPSDRIANVFHPLTQGTDDNPPATSLGLGLFITKEIVGAHGGAVSVDSNDEEGTIFTARFPRQPTVSGLIASDENY